MSFNSGFLISPGLQNKWTAQALDIIHSVERHQEDGFSFSLIASEVGLSESTIERYLKPEKWETMTEERLLDYRRALSADGLRLATHDLVYSYYSQLIGTAIPIRLGDGALVFRVNVSRFAFLQNVGLRYNFNVQHRGARGQVVWVERRAYDENLGMYQ